MTGPRTLADDGVAGALVEYVTLFPAIVALSWIALGILFVVLREWRLPFDPAYRPSLVAVVPAHDEELVIEAAIQALLAQTWSPLEIHVVSDGSTDDTAAIARRFEPRGVIVHELHGNVGKSGALQHVLDRADADLFLVVDADTQVHPEALEHMVQQFADPRVGAVTGHARIGNVSGALTAMQAMEYSVIVGLAKRAEQFWGGLYTISGAAACFRTEALRRVGGWSVPTVTEDIEVSWRLQRAGWRLAYEPRALFSLQAPTRLRALHRQRRRWARGMVEVFRLHWNVAATPNRALIPIAAQVVGVGAWMLIATALVLHTTIALLTGRLEPAATDAFLQSGWYVLFLWTFGLFGVQAFVATLFDATYVQRGWRAFPLFLAFPIYFWVVVYPSYVAGATRGLLGAGSGKWARTERSRQRSVLPVARRADT